MHDHGKVITQLSNGILQLDIPDVDKLPLAVYDSKITKTMVVNSPSILPHIEEKSYNISKLYSNVNALRTSLIVSVFDGEIILDGVVNEGQKTDIKLYLSEREDQNAE